jgi:hypothetical protein
MVVATCSIAGPAVRPPERGDAKRPGRGRARNLASGSGLRYPRASVLSANILTRHRVFCALLLASLPACGNDEAEPAFPLEATLADCGSSLVQLLGAPTNAEPSFDASYSDAVAFWPFGADHCSLGAFTGQCADGKRLLYRNSGFVSEIRYFDGEQLVGLVDTDDVGVCPSVCPRSRFYGDIDSVRCEAPVFEDLCPDSSAFLADDGLWMPFANGQAPGGCGPL